MTSTPDIVASLDQKTIDDAIAAFWSKEPHRSGPPRATGMSAAARVIIDAARPAIERAPVVHMLAEDSLGYLVSTRCGGPGESSGHPRKVDCIDCLRASVQYLMEERQARNDREWKADVARRAPAVPLAGLEEVTDDDVARAGGWLWDWRNLRYSRANQDGMRTIIRHARQEGAEAAFAAVLRTSTGQLWGAAMRGLMDEARRSLRLPAVESPPEPSADLVERVALAIISTESITSRTPMAEWEQWAPEARAAIAVARADFVARMTSDAAMDAAHEAGWSHANRTSPDEIGRAIRAAVAAALGAEHVEPSADVVHGDPCRCGARIDDRERDHHKVTCVACLRVAIDETAKRASTAERERDEARAERNAALRQVSSSAHAAGVEIGNLEGALVQMRGERDCARLEREDALDAIRARPAVPDAVRRLLLVARRYYLHTTRGAASDDLENEMGLALDAAEAALADAPREAEPCPVDSEQLARWARGKIGTTYEEMAKTIAWLVRREMARGGAR